MTKLDFHRFQVRHFSNNFERSPCYCKMGATLESRFRSLLTYTIHHQAKYQRLNANTLYVAAILFSRSTLHRETLSCLPNSCNPLAYSANSAVLQLVAALFSFNFIIQELHSTTIILHCDCCTARYNSCSLLLCM